MSKIESRTTWRSEWSWDRYGQDFVIDHIIPISKWKDPSAAFHHTNCQLLSPLDNASKKDKMPEEWNTKK